MTGPDPTLATGLVALALTLSVALAPPMRLAGRAAIRLGCGGRAAALRHLSHAVGLGIAGGMLAAVGLGFALGGGRAALGLAVAATALLLALFDFRWRWLPREWTLGLIASGLLAALARGAADGLGAAATGALLLAGLLMALREGHRRLRGVEGLGLGDVWLAGGIGAHAGLAAGPLVLAAGALAALTGQALQAGVQGAKAPRPIPLGGYLSIAFAIWIPLQYQI